MPQRLTTQQRSAQTGALRFGSLKYMSPERREGDRGEIASDVYALGLTLLELLRGSWLPLLPLDVAEHDEALATLAPLGTGSRRLREFADLIVLRDH
jgi:serine/threonine protein kinase